MTNTRRSTSSLIVHEQPKSPISEKFRGIRSNIMFANPDSAVQSIVITSEAPGAGKSTIAANLAVAYAQAGYKTLIVDGDMRKPTQHYIFNLPNNEGLSSLLLNWSTYQDSIISTEIQDLDVLTSGPIPPNPSELITSRAFANLYDTLLMNYNYVIIDTPPVNTVTDAQLFSKFTGNVVYVVNSENNNKDEVKKGKELIEATGAKLLGVVLNRMPKDKSASYYAYYGTDES
ncbi:polysaccharide biosynthesis tyrosine autokinase [Staphylococcus aureus]|uniref:polysaccharide biosynthesis tyrosine autokinase n=1 Tax=Staphylococcus aureus TaxID=1280 RepID=UPI00397E0E75